MLPVKAHSAENLSDRVVTYLIDYTRKHRLKSGEDVPSEGVLSTELKVSRGVVREAYRSLKTAGILDISNGRPPRVGRLTNQPIAQFLHHALHTEQASAADALDVRSALEVRAAELAAANRADVDAAALQREAAIMLASTTQRRRFINADIRFHEALGRATGNPLFALLISALREALDVTIRAGFDSRRTREEHERVAQIHIDIADAVTARRVARARRMMLVHFKEAVAFVGRQTDAPPTLQRRVR
jgi:GntR family transcriptional regulator, transcriptional repressor for pyruvate dehydrogenase complex